MSSIKEISVIGAGTMGLGIAHSFAQYNYQVNLVDKSETALEKASATIGKNLERQAKKGILDDTQVKETLGRINFVTDLAVVKNSQLIIEAIDENLEAKSNLLSLIGKHIDDSTIVSSNTSSISITKLAEQLPVPENFVGFHFMNPVPVMKLVEVIRGQKTSDQVVETILDLTRSLKKTPVQVNDYPGFISNRILMPMINEAIHSLHEGVASAEAIDDIMKLGMAHPMGPLQLADFIGLDVCLSILEVLYHNFQMDKYAPCILLRKKVEAGLLGKKTGEGFFSYN